jgi:hypothetical protein
MRRNIFHGRGTCGTGHDTPNVGDPSFPMPLNIGTGDPMLSNADLNFEERSFLNATA